LTLTLILTVLLTHLPLRTQEIKINTKAKSGGQECPPYTMLQGYRIKCIGTPANASSQLPGCFFLGATSNSVKL
jgi:hypothetical protein